MNASSLIRGSLFAEPSALVNWLDRASMLSNLAAQPGKNYFGDPLPSASVRGSVALIPVQGPMIHKAGFVEKMFGAVAHDQIAADLEAAAANDTIKSIVLVIDSPGGTVTGTPELAAAVATVAKKKPVFAFSDSLMASAAYYVAAGCTRIFCTPSANVGSVGTMLEVADVSEALRARGVNIELFTSGPLKGTGHPAKPVSTEQRAYLQGRVDDMAGQFKKFVTSHRASIPSSAMQGQCFTGKDALKQGMVDAVVNGLSEVLKLTENPASVPSVPRGFRQWVEDFESTGMSKAQAITAAVQSCPEAHAAWLQNDRTL